MSFTENLAYSLSLSWKILDCKQNFKSINNRLYMLLKYYIFQIFFTCQEPEWLIFDFVWLYLSVTIISVANLVILLNEKLFHRFNVTNNAALSKFNCKVLNLKGGNKRLLKDLKICKAVVKGKHESSMFLPIGWIKLHSSKLN